MRILSLLAVLSSTAYLSVVLFLRRGLLRLRPCGRSHNLSFSVVIAARNEEAAIPACLQSVLRQSIGENRFEVIVADDRSDDATPLILAEFRERFPNFSFVAIKETPSGVAPKKHALTRAIARAKNDIVVVTDADCVVPSTWLETIDRMFEPATGFVQGMTRYERPSGMNPLFFGLQAVEFLSHGIVSAAAIGAGVPINSNANNLAFRREVFSALGGYGCVESVVSGDDDLLLQKIWREGSWKIRYMIDPEGAVKTAPTATMKGVFEQRKRWGSKTVHYHPIQILLLGSVFLFYIVLSLCIFGTVSKRRVGKIAGAMLGIKMLGESFLMLPGTRLFRQQPLRRLLIPASLIQLPLVILAVLFGTFGNFRWKDALFTRKIGD